MTDSSAALASRGIGAMFFAFFGAVWLIVWSQLAFGLRPVNLLAIGAIAIAIFWFACRLYRRNRAAHAAEGETPEKKRAGRIFNIVNITQWVLILVVANVLNNIGLKDWILASIMLIVGIHFFPLARAFANPMLNYTGGAMILAAIVYPFVAPKGAANPVGSLLAGLILWISATISLVARPGS